MVTITRTRRAASAALAVLAVCALAACSTVAPQDSIEQQITSQLGTETASCPGDLDATVGTAMTCSATAGGETFDVKVTVTSLQGSDINFDIERVGAVPAAPAPADPTEEMTVDSATGAVDGPQVASAVSAELAAIAGQEPDSVTCPDLPATVGASIRCQLVAGTDTLGVTVTTSSVQGGRVQFEIQVDEAPS